RKPWTFLWKDIEHQATDEVGVQMDYSWHVERVRYEAILEDHARSLGVEIFRGYSVRKAEQDDSGRVTGVTWTCGEETGKIAAAYTVDCAGGKGPLTRAFGGKSIDEGLRNIAFYGYYKGVNLAAEWCGP